MNVHRYIMIWTTAVFMFACIQFAAFAQQKDGQQLDPKTLQEMQRMIQKDTWPYADLEKVAPNPQDASSFIEILANPWRHGMPHQLLEVVAMAPAHFAPAIRERLMPLPQTLDDYLRDSARREPKYPITYPATAEAKEKMLFGPPAARVLSLVANLNRAHAEPILREFHDRMRALQQQAEERLEALERIGAGDAEAVKRMRDLALGFAGWRLQAIKAAHRLKSPMFVEEGIETLKRLDRIANSMAQNGLAAYLADFAENRPQLYQRLKAIAERFETARTPNLRILASSVKDALERIQPPAKENDE